MQYDPGSHKYETFMRTYDQERGAWTSQDPLGFASGEINYYRSRKNNPQKYVDHSGKKSAVPNTGNGTSCEYKARQVKESCQTNLNRVSTYTEGSLVGACCGAGPGFAACATAASGTVGMAQVLGTLDCNTQAQAAYQACESDFSKPENNAPKPDAGDYMDIGSGTSDVIDLLKLIKQ